VQRYDIFSFFKINLENYSEYREFPLFCGQKEIVLFPFLNQYIFIIEQLSTC
jgi:hypothetical protein